MSDRFDARKVPVDAVVAVVVTVLNVLSVGVGVDAVDCDSVVKVVGVVALSRTHTEYHLSYSKVASYRLLVFTRSCRAIRHIAEFNGCLKEYST